MAEERIAEAVPNIIDRLSVFVSSTINECQRERQIAAQAITSINHDPVLFESLGARPYAPREVYKARLEASQIFVAIYREQYGWIAADMDVSGIEDEFRIATTRGIDRLVYVYAHPTARDPRLAALIDKAKASGLTLALYGEPEELYDRLRDDVTAVVSSRFASQLFPDALNEAARDVLGALIPVPRQRLRRALVEQSLLTQVSQSPLTVVHGPLGSGKTVLLAQVAVEKHWLFVDARDLTGQEVISRCANVLARHLNEPARVHRHQDAAVRALREVWRRVDDLVLVVDAVGETSPLLDIFISLPSAPQRRLVVCPRSEASVPRHQRFGVPKFTEDEVGALVTQLRDGKSPDPGEIAQLSHASAGNPLYLRFYAAGGAPQADRSLREIEFAVVRNLDGRVREIASYLALAGRALSLQNLHTLLGGDDDGIEATADWVRNGGAVLGQTRGQVDLVHEHLRETLIDQLKLTPARLGFFATRLGEYLTAEQDFATAFLVFDLAGERRHAAQLLERAAFQVMLRGGGRQAITIWRRKAEQAREDGDRVGEVQSLMILAQSLEQSGDHSAATDMIERSRAVAVGDAELLLSIRELELGMAVERLGDPLLTPELEALRARYQSSGRPFDAGRMSVLLSVQYIAGEDFVQAAEAARSALETFTALGDAYGIRSAKLNLASALSGIPQGREEARTLATELERGVDPDLQPRERAIICNLMARRYRLLDQPELAEEFAREAVTIGERLGNKRVVAMNRINLGNTLRDQGQLERALVEYRLADRTAAEAGLRRQEAAANEVIASVLNEQDKYDLALIHARHSVAVARDVNDAVVEARASEECGIALEAENKIEEAAAAYASGAATLAALGRESGLLVSLLNSALELAVKGKRLDLTVNTLTAVFEQRVPERASAHSHWDEVRSLVQVIPSTARQLAAGEMMRVTSMCLADVLAEMPAVLERRIVLQTLSALASAELDLTPRQRAAAMAGVLLASDATRLTLADLVLVAEQACAVLPGVYFKPGVDGAAHWTVRLPVSEDVICTIAQLDDRTTMAATAMLVALALVSFAPAIRRNLLGGERLPRLEFRLTLVTYSDFASHIEPELSGLDQEPPGRCVVGRSTDLSQADQPPTVVICRNDFGERWFPLRKTVADLHYLLAQALEAMTEHLLAREVDAETIRPKVMTVLKQMVGRVSDTH
jgi:tetratricopeptide (TPR) repeat protein